MANILSAPKTLKTQNNPCFTRKSFGHAVTRCSLRYCRCGWRVSIDFA